LEIYPVEGSGESHHSKIPSIFKEAREKYGK
jgi:hypothetical protein